MVRTLLPADPRARPASAAPIRRAAAALLSLCSPVVDYPSMFEGCCGWQIEHTYRFCKQVLNWTTPRVRQPEQADCWTWLVLLAYTQLRLARRAIDDVHLPWERPQRPTRRALTPARVRQAFPQLLVALGTPANAPKPCGR